MIRSTMVSSICKLVLPWESYDVCNLSHCNILWNAFYRCSYLGYACWSTYAAVSALILDHDFHEEVKAGQNCCQSSHRGHPGLAINIAQSGNLQILNFYKMPSHWLVQFGSVASSLPMSGITAASWKTINNLNSLRTGFILTKCTSFPRMTILPV